MKEESVYVGVDVSKDTLDITSSGTRETRQFTNNSDGIAQAVQFISTM